ncbi:psbP domain-containing protein 7, chloroplastic [Malania oleifera]|uniref:psbP domain-containing protein 7, chloroplastic n=1 Tax=Malania oleifera TaxID=397392 RepID=UPI0025AE9C92|nr:psbP domain-containing protein 7, chloroplastic [Malania oleifera]
MQTAMALPHHFRAWDSLGHRRTYMTQSSGDRKGSLQEVAPPLGRDPAEEFSPLAGVFRRRLLAGVGSASLVAVGANFGGITSSLLGFSPETCRSLKVDVLYPIEGYSRCIDTNKGFEFIYPANWVGDQTLLYRAAGKAELERSLDPPPLNNANSGDRRRQTINEPVVAFGPPGSTGELNVSIVVSPVPLDFSIETFGGPKEVGEAVIRTIARSSQRPEVRGALIEARLREDPQRNAKYYELEFRVESSLFRRHNVAVCCAQRGRLFTLNAQAPETAWPKVKSAFYKIADSFRLAS